MKEGQASEGESEDSEGGEDNTDFESLLAEYEKKGASEKPEGGPGEEDEEKSFRKSDENRVVIDIDL